MGDRHRYKSRDFDFAHLLLTLRRKASLTQEEVALRLGVSDKSIRNWEGGSNYPSELNLQRLIELYLHSDVFAPGQEQDKARLLWEQLHACNPQRVGVFNERWFATLLQAWQTRRTHQAPHPEEPQQPESPDLQPSVSLSTLETVLQDVSRPASRLLRGDWSEVLDVSTWYGRTEELAELEQWLLRDQCRLVTVLGMGGIGKTTLTVKLIQQVASHFDYILWHSLYNAPSLEDVLLDWLPVLSEQRYTHLPQELDQSLALLIGLLQEHRCLLVLDNLETLFQKGVLGGRCREGYEGYATLIQRIAQTVHQSCLILTCRELSPELGAFTGLQAPVRVFRLGGLPVSVSQQMLQDKGLFGGQEAWGDLVERYAGNPLALKIVAEVVCELFGGDITAFLAEGFTTFHGIRQLLTQQFERLSVQEQGLLYWLAIERELITLETLREDLRYPIAMSEVVEAMHSLYSRSLVERGERGAVFTLQPVVLEYVTERLVEQIGEEILTLRPELLVRCALLKAQARDYLRASQARLLVQPVLERLLSRLGAPQSVEAQLEHLLQRLRSLPRAQQGYGGGNVVNLLVRLNGHVRGRDCSQLTIWQADLQQTETQDANFAESDLVGSAFMETIEGISSVALSANGQYVAAGTFTGYIPIWHVPTGQPLLVLVGHARVVWSMAFNSQSTLLASVGYDGEVKVWEVSSGECVSVLRGHTKWIKSVAFHPEGRLLATCGDDRSIRLWDLAAGCCIHVWSEYPAQVWSVAFSPDGLLLAAGYADGVVKVWELGSRQCRWTVSAHRSGLGVVALVFSPNGELLVSGGFDTMIMVWQASSGEALAALSGHADAVHSLAFNTEGLLASGSFDRTVKLWQVEGWREAARCVGTLQGHSHWVQSISFGPDGLLASGSQDGVVKLWQVSRGGEEGRCLRTLQGYSCLINGLAFNPDGSLLVSIENNGMVRRWEIQSGHCLSAIPRQAPSSFALVFSPDGQLFAASSPDKNVKLWEASSGRLLRMLRGHQGMILALAFSPDGRFLISGSVDTTIKQWAVSSGQCLTTFQGHADWIWSLAYSPDGSLLASGDGGGAVKLWEMSGGQCLKTLQGSTKGVVTLTFTPDGSTLLCSHEQGLVSVWDVQSGDRLRTLQGIGEDHWLQLAAFSADGSLLAIANNDQTVKVWDMNAGQLLRSFPCHACHFWAVAFSADQRLLACGTQEGMIMLWEWQTGKCLMTLRCERPYERMNISGAIGITETQQSVLKALGAVG